MPWYKERLATKQQLEVAKLQKDIAYLKKVSEEKPRLGVTLKERIVEVEQELAYVSSEQYLQDIDGSIGTDPYPFKCKRN